MAFFEREELKTRLLENAEFKNFLELEPHIREAAQALFSAKYAVTLDILNRHRSDFVVDLFLSPHVDLLYREIRQRALVQAFSPYASLELHTLSSLFSTPMEQITAEVSELIEEGKIKGRLDHPNKVAAFIVMAYYQIIKAREVYPQAHVFDASSKMAVNYIKSARSLLLNLRAADAELEVRSAQESEEMKASL
jgi:COP9 signalosome complex subunit 1